MPLPKELLEVLACPFCKSDVSLQGEDRIVCSNKECALKFPIKEDIPVMLIEEAEKPCPGCGKQRELKDEVITCPSCGKSIEFKRITPK